jgi:hypothetical protein
MCTVRPLGAQLLFKELSSYDVGILGCFGVLGFAYKYAGFI